MTWVRRWWTVDGVRLTACLSICALGAGWFCGCRTPQTAHRTPNAADVVGVLVLAHGGSARWEREVSRAVAQAPLPYPTEVAFGMGMHRPEVRALQRAVERLERAGVTRLIAVPLLVSSSSEVMRQYQYLLRLRPEGPWADEVQPIAVRLPLTMTGPLDDDPVVTGILLERALEMSARPEDESVLLVAHGPVADEDEAAWLTVMGRLARDVQARGRFRAVVPVTMRDDAPAPTQERATRHMREVVRQQGETGRVLVVPLLLASGGVESKIPRRLQGLRFRYQGRTLLPHPQIAQWIARQVEAAASAGVPVERPEATSRAPRL